MSTLCITKIAEKVNGKIIGDHDIIINSLSSIEKARNDQITFFSDKKYINYLNNLQAGVIVIREEDLSLITIERTLLVVKDTYIAYAIIAQLFDTTPAHSNGGISKSATIAETAKLGDNVSIAENVVIEDNVIIGDNVSIAPGCFIGRSAKIGKNTKLWANITIYHGVTIGNNCLIQANTVIGSDGFGYANDKGKWLKIPQLGSVRIGDNVEIGASTCIDRGAIDDTIIEDNVIIDNLCQIAHNVHIGSGSAVAGATVLAGSVTIGKYCLIGGASVLNGHIQIADHVKITGMAMIMRSIDNPGTYSSGIPAQENSKWRKTAALTMKIDELYKKIKAIEKNN